MTTRRLLIAAAAALVLLTAPAAQAADRVTVFAAASLKTALDAVAAQWTAETQNKAVISYAASSALAKQIEQGAPADVFFSADLDWMNYLGEKNLIDKASVTRLLGNDIVLIAPKDSTATAKIAPGFKLAELLGGGRLAMGDVKSVPAGKYGKAALESLGVWASVENSLAQAENVRAALKLVATGEAPLGIVYRTDAEAEPTVRIVDVFPSDSHPPIVYPVALTANAKSDAARDFLAYLKTPAAHAIFKSNGFRLLE
ncbi:MAG: molybdate ABC transporter substrate-binding protein [Aestuariivirga sp.]|nr:molybdate ABC transporter substrate-binding protein [Aestuariivirga sp.]